MIQRQDKGRLDDFVGAIEKINPLHGKYLDGILCSFKQSESEDCERLLEFYQIQGKSINSIADSYLMFVNDTLEETKYFMEHDEYRYHKFSEVAEAVYYDEQYMEKYMIGLSLSLYLWEQHRKCISYFEEVCSNYISPGSSYLEIGPGHGKYFCDVVKHRECERYVAVDISETSLKMTQDILRFFCTEKEIERCVFSCEDFIKMGHSQKYDFIVMCEVLEHVEHPSLLLRNLHNCLKQGGHAFVSVPINAPEKDHICLFRSIEEVVNLMEQSGVSVLDQRAFCTKNKTLKQAIKQKDAILTAFVLG